MSNVIASLNNEEKNIFVKALMHLIKADEIINEQEKQFLKEIITIYNIDIKTLSQESLSEEQLLDKLKQTISERTKALFLIKEMLTIANIDNDLADKEINFIEKTAQALNIEPEKILQIHQLVLNRKLWLQQYAKIMEDVA